MKSNVQKKLWSDYVSRFECSLDTNVVLALLTGDRPEQARKVKELLIKATKQIAVADIALVESIFVLTREYGLGREQVKVVLEGLLSLEVLNCNRVAFRKALEVFELFPALSFEDCLLATYADLNDAAPLYTFDKKLALQHLDAVLL
jgi:predicted nucleic-acid-binding protein